MKETKISVLRQFGSEQFSATISFDKVLNELEMANEIDVLGKGISKAFLNVLAREENEKMILLKAAEARTQTNKNLDASIQAELKSANEVKQSLNKVQKFVTKK
jgi:hypothetical protein